MKKRILLLVLLVLSSNVYYAHAQVKIDIGGALRFNYNVSSFNEQQAKRGGDINYDMFAISPRVSYDDLSLNVEYRLYEDQSGGGMLRFGYIGYNLSPTSYLHFGLTRVPFGIEPYNSHGYFLGMGYYLGLEDDYDAGVKYVNEGKHIDLHLAFFKNSDYASVVNGKESARRYSYDIGDVNRETNQLNAKIAFKFGENIKSKIGLSAEYGGLFNTETEKMGYHYALAGHYEMEFDQFKLKAQASNYAYSPKNKEGVSSDIMQMVAYNASYDVASKGTLYSVGAAYNFPINKKLLSSVQVYNDFAYLDKAKKEFEASISNTLGVLFVSGNIYTYMEYIVAKNQPWFGGNWEKSFGAGGADAKWENKININVGYYF